MGLFLEKTGVCEHETQEYSPVPDAKQTLSAHFAPRPALCAPLAQHGLLAPSRKPLQLAVKPAVKPVAKSPAGTTLQSWQKCRNNRLHG
ncbi:hypothetical protein D3C86_1814990 [compost metagenome]